MKGRRPNRYMRGGFRFRADGSPVVNTRLTRSMTRGQFLRTAGVAGAGVAGAMIGGAGVASAEGQMNHNILREPGNEVIYIYPIDPTRPPPTHPNALESSGAVHLDANNVQLAINSVRDGGTVILMLHDRFDVPRPFNFGTSNVKILNKSVNVVGQSSGGNKPLIIGSNTSIIWSEKPENTGIFYIQAPGCEVEINNLEIHHDFAPFWDSYSSVTIANRGSDELRVIDCDIETFATSAINSATTAAKNKIIRGCKIRGYAAYDQNEPYELEGNYSSINLSSFGGPIDLRGGNLEITDCHLDSALFIGVAAFGFLSDTNTQVDISGNTIGYNPVSPGTDPFQATSNGIYVGLYTFPRGTVDIYDNYIKLQRFYVGTPGFVGISNGIGVQVHSLNPNESVTTTISGNYIEIAQPVPRPVLLALNGIMYVDYAMPDGSSHASATIQGNFLSSSINPAKRGISLGVDLFGDSTLATVVAVINNNYAGLSVLDSHVYLGEYTHNNSVNEPTLACADIDDDGTNNSITASCGLCPC